MESKSERFGSIHIKYTKISEKCAKYGYKASELTKTQPMNCIFCYKEILQSIRDKHAEVRDIISSEEDESFAHLYIIVIYMEKFLRARLTVVSRHMAYRNWYQAYSDSREFCGYIALVFEYWNRVVRDAFWPFLIIVSDNFLSRFPVEYRKLIT